jgi:uncharacterized membrane protein
LRTVLSRQRTFPNLDWSRVKGKTLSRWVLGSLFVAAGANHLVNPAFYLRIMPGYLPWHRELVDLSGIAEMLLGAMLLARGTRVLAAWGLIALLIAVFPANVNMALHPEAFPGLPPLALWARLPLQGVLILWVWWHTRPENG